MEPEKQLAELAALRLRPTTTALYRRWVAAFQRSGLPLVEYWLAWSEGKSRSSLAVARAALVDAGLWDPELDPAHRGLTRAVGADTEQAPPLLLLDFAAWARWLRVEDVELWRCVVLGWWGGLRMSEVVALRASDVQVDPSTPGVVRLRILKSKTSDRAAWVTMPERPTMPAGDPAAVHRDLWDWPEERRLWSRSERQFSRRFAARVEEAHRARVLSRGDYTPHSMRAGIATELDAAGVGPGEIARHCRWRSLGQVLAYVRDRTESPLGKIRT